MLFDLPLLGMKGWQKINTNNFNEFRRCENICLDEDFLNLGQIVLNVSLIMLKSFIYPYLPLIYFQTEPEISRASYFDGTERSPR